MKIVRYSNDRFHALINFLKANWAESHSIYEQSLFNWQYGGPYNDSSSSRLLVDECDNICGFLGAIPYPFLHETKELHSAGFAVWVVDNAIKNSGAGLYLRKEVEADFDFVYTLGAAQSALRLYTRQKYTYFEHLHRYVMPLNIDAYPLILTSAVSEFKLTEWFNKIILPLPAIPLEHIHASELAEQYTSGIAPYFLLCPKKDKQFWTWRYLNSAGFTYSFYSDAGGTVIFRIEAVHKPEDRTRHGLKILRIIEVIPSDGQVWNGTHSSDLEKTILSVVSYGKIQNCVLADFQISSARLGVVLHNAGFKEQMGADITDIIQLFSPFKQVPPINILCRLPVNRSSATISQDDMYFVKSDCDMDRPNFLL